MSPSSGEAKKGDQPMACQLTANIGAITHYLFGSIPAKSMTPNATPGNVMSSSSKSQGGISAPLLASASTVTKRTLQTRSVTFSPHSRLISAVLALFMAGVLLSPQSLQAEPVSLHITSSGSMGVYADREYLWANGMMAGKIVRSDNSVGHYNVPVVLMFPDKLSNGYGLVDVVNTAAFSAYTADNAPEGKRVVYHTGDLIFSDYLRREGFSYLGVMSQRMVTWELGPDYGVIENGLDGYDIIADAAHLLRHPIKQGPIKQDPITPDNSPLATWTAADKVIGFGLSHTAGTLRSMVQQGRNQTATGELVFDGVLAAVPVACFPLNNDESTRNIPDSPSNPVFFDIEACEDNIPDHGKFITVISESDYWQFPPTRPLSANHRQYELAGISHIPADMIDVRFLGAPRQNPATFKPALKAALRNLVEWLDLNKLPPDSVYLQGGLDTDGKFQLSRDDDGNVKGGVRFPHMPDLLADGAQAGAPLGVYGGLDTRFLDPFNLFPLLGGTFEPFSDEKITKLYPDTARYVARVTAAADKLLEQRFILPEDHRSYIRSAKYWRSPLAGR